MLNNSVQGKPLLLRFLKKATLALILLSLAGCDAVGVKESAELSVTFAGVSGIEHNIERKETHLKWPLASVTADSFSYKVYEIQLESLGSISLADKTSTNVEGIAHKVYLFEDTALMSQVVGQGKVLAELGGDISQYQIATNLNPNLNYAYMVKVNADGIDDPNIKVLFLQSRVSDFLNTGSYPGCLTGESLSPGSITVNFDFPEIATKVVIKRDGETVFSTSNSETTSYVDKNLMSGSEYTYVCEATIGGNAIAGDHSLILSPMTFSYAGCTSATAVSESEIELEFAIPSEADRFRILRNSREIFSTTKANATKFVDEDLKTGRCKNLDCSGPL